MAEDEVPQFRNKGVLLVAVILGGVVVIIYNVHINKVRTSLEGRRVQLLKFARTMTAGQKIDRKDLIQESIRKDDAMALGSVVEYESRNFVVGRRVRRSVSKDEWVQWLHVTGEVEGLTRKISDDMVGITLELDPRTSPGPLCRPGDRVNIVAQIQISEDAPPRIFRIIRNVEVLSTGSDTMIRAGESGQRTSRSYRAIQIEVHPNVSLELHALLGLAKGKVWLEVLPQDAAQRFNEKTDGIINPAEPVLKQLLEAGVSAAG